MKYKQTNLFGGEDEVSEPMTEQDLYKRIRLTTGVDAMHEKAMEEMVELTEAILDRKNNPGNVIEEIADVEIMIEQLKLFYGHGEVRKVREYKLKRTEKRLKEGKL